MGKDVLPHNTPALCILLPFRLLYFLLCYSRPIEIVGVLVLTRCSRKLKPTRSDGLSAYGIEIGPSFPNSIICMRMVLTCPAERKA